MLASMTAFTSHAGSSAKLGFTWSWDIRGVNAKGLDVRLRLPDWIEGLEQGVKAAINGSVARGNVTLGLRLQRDEQAAEIGLNSEQLARVLASVKEVAAMAEAEGVTLEPVTALDLMAARGVMDAAQTPQETGPICAALLADLAPVLEDFVKMRRAEGAALAEVLETQIAEIERLTADALKAAEARKPHVAETLRSNLKKLMDAGDGLDEDRLAQELALLAVKADVTEELDRLSTHVAAARALLAQGSPVGRKLDFLMQEFNREANTLCAKSQDSALTAIGLDLKATIDQMREQVQNVE